VYVPQTILDLIHALLIAYKSEPQLLQFGKELYIQQLMNTGKIN
jgi:hypothetical protein